MAIVSDVEIRLRADIARLQQDLNAARRSVSGAVGDIKKTLAGMAAGFSLVNLAQQAIAAQRQFDKLNTSLVTATGSTKAAGEAFAVLQDFASKTPFSVSEVTSAFLKLRNLGLTPSERALRSYGDTASGMGKDLNQLIEAVADAATGEFERLKEFGIKSKKQGDQVAFTFQGTTTKVGNSAAEIEAYLMAIGEVNFAGGMERQAGTLDGALSNLGDTWDQTLMAFNQSGFGDVVHGSVLALSGTLGDLIAMFKAVSGAADEEGKKVEEIGPLHKGLTTFFETIMVLGTNVSYVFKTIGKDMGSFAAQVGVLFRGGATGMLNGTTMKEIRAISAERTAEAQRERVEVDATTAKILGAAAAAQAARAKEAAARAADTTDRLAKYKIVSTAAKEVSDAERKAAEKNAKAYADFSKRVDERVAETAREAAGLAPLNEAQKLELDLKEKLAEGTLRLTATQEASARSRIAQIQSNLASVESQKAYTKMLEEAGTLEKEMAGNREDAVKAARDEVKANRELVTTFGMTAAAIAQLEVARLEEQLAQRASVGMTLDEIEHLEQLISLKKQSAAAVADVEALEETKAFWGDIEKTAHDTFVSIADGGKNAFQRLKDTAKNTFFDWLYQMTLKKWIVNIQANASTAGGGVGGAASAIGSALGMSGGVMSSIGGAVSSIGGMVSSFAPVIGGIIGAVSLLKSAFSRGPKEFTGESTLTGSLGTGGFSGTMNSEWTKKGGWFRSDKSGTDKAAVDATVASGLSETYKAITSASADYARVLGVNADSITSRTQAMSIALGKDEAANQKAIADFFGGVADAVAGEILPGIARFQQAGEGAAATLQRITVNFQAVDTAMAQMGFTSAQAFRATGVASIEARERLVALAGGIESLAGQSQFFADNFLTGAQKIAPIQKQVSDQLAALGYAGMMTTANFREAVRSLAQSGALASETGAATYASLLALAPKFKAMTDYMIEIARTDADTAVQSLQRAVDAQRKSVEAAYTGVMESLRTRLDGVSASVERITDLSQALKGSLIGVDAPGAASASREVASAEIAAALAIAKARGTLPSADDLRDALGAVGRTSADDFATLVEYQRAAARSNAQLNELGGLTDAQLSTAELQLRALEEQQTQAEAAHEAELGRLDGIMANAQLQLDAANDINTSVLSVGDATIAALGAIRNLSIANGGYGGVAVPSVPPPPVVAAPPQSGTMPVESGLLAELRRMNERLGNIEVTNQQMAADNAQLTRQFNDVTAGGNALLTESA